jgi:peptide/nickel transport system permease protein
LGRYLAQRLVGVVIVVLGVSTVVFIILHLSGDPVALMISPDADRQDYERLRSFMGLDKPLYVQYARFLTQLAQGDFGDSFQYSQPAMPLILERVPATVQLTIAAILLSLAIALPFGVLSAVRQNSLFDYTASFVTLLGQSMPNYWLGIMLILFFAVQLHWLPTSGRGDLRHLILPAVTLGLHPASKFTRLIRSEMLEILTLDYIRTARAKGLAENVVLIRHALKNAAIAVVTIIGMDLGYLLGGAVITETIFAWPGIGRLVVSAIFHRDFPLVQADVLFIALVVVLVNFLVDVLYSILDPRIRLA